MNENKSLHIDFLLDSERFSPSPLRLRFIIPVIGVLCLLAPLVVWQLDASTFNEIAFQKQSLETEIAKLKSSHELVLKDRAEETDLSAQLQQLGFYERSKNLVGATLAHLTNCVTSSIQLTELRFATQMPPGQNGLQPKPKTAAELEKHCPPNMTDAVSLHLCGRYYQSGIAPVELNRFLVALQGNAFTSLVTQVNRKVDYREDTPRNRGASARKDVYYFEINYECLPRRFQ
jgi:hypothetical protein